MSQRLFGWTSCPRTGTVPELAGEDARATKYRRLAGRFEAGDTSAPVQGFKARKPWRILFADYQPTPAEGVAELPDRVKVPRVT